VRICLDRLLECSHLLDPQHLATPLLVDRSTLLSLHLQFLGQAFFLLLQKLNFFLELLNLLIRLLALFTLKAIDSFEQAVRVFDFVFNERPQLLEEGTKIFRLFLRLFQFLIEELFAISKQTDQLFVLLLEHLDFFEVLALAGVHIAAVVIGCALRLHLLHHVLAAPIVVLLAALLR